MLNFGSAARNIGPILEVWKKEITSDFIGCALELASGSGQHVIQLAKHFHGIQFTPSDIEDTHIASINAYIQECGLTNINEPVYIDGSKDWKEWGIEKASLDIMFATNCIHIAPIEVCEGLIAASEHLLKEGGMLIFYGPFIKDGKLTPQSNVDFDAKLRSRNVSWGIRDIVDVTALASKANLTLHAHYDMPSNNNMYFFKKQ